MSHSEPDSERFRRFWHSFGPAIIVACVVLGPGSILTSSKIGCQFGYQMEWVLVGAGLLMVGTIATGMRIGVSLEHSPCRELASRLGRPVALLAGVTVFLMASCFQFSNNLGVLASVEPLFDVSNTGRIVLLVGLNGLLIACLFGLQKLYVPVERLMMILMGLMLLGFAANLVRANPNGFAVLLGLVPSLPEQLVGSFLPRIEHVADMGNPTAAGPKLIDPWITLQGLIVTTFSIGGAFYQAYLVKEKGWTRGQLGQGLVDSIAGTVILVGITLMVMITAASVLAGNVKPADLKSAGEVAQQLEPLFGPYAKMLFCLGIFAGAISSFLVNSIVGGTLLADGLGLDARMDSVWTKCFTVVVMLIGMFIALATSAQGRVPLIIFAQAMTVLGGPVLAFSMLYLGTRRDAQGNFVATPWMLIITGCGFLIVIALAVRTAVRIWLQVSLM
jgi:Mn2+/Fe2+ NRAMP family transporter